MKEFIKQWLIEGQSKVYSRIIDLYAKEFDQCGATMFIDWLSKELDIDKKLINRNSLNSAYFRKKAKQKHEKKINTIAISSIQKQVDNEMQTNTEQAFTFSSGFDNNQNQTDRFKEL